jgi:predicted oxidoreductase
MIPIILKSEIDEQGKRKEKVCIVCECGVNVCGNSIDNAKANLKIHKKSKLHLNQMVSSDLIKIKEGEIKKK